MTWDFSSLRPTSARMTPGEPSGSRWESTYSHTHTPPTHPPGEASGEPPGERQGEPLGSLSGASGEPQGKPLGEPLGEPPGEGAAGGASGGRTLYQAGRRALPTFALRQNVFPPNLLWQHFPPKKEDIPARATKPIKTLRFPC